MYSSWIWPKSFSLAMARWRGGVREKTLPHAAAAPTTASSLFPLAIQDHTVSIETTATMLTFGQWINNKETPSLDAATIDVENPTDNSIVGKVPAGCAADAEAALTSAKKAQVAWAKVPVGTRAKVLKGFAEVIRGCREELIETLISEQSKVAGLATVEIGAFLLCLVICAWFASSHNLSRAQSSQRPITVFVASMTAVSRAMLTNASLFVQFHFFCSLTQ